MHPKGASKNIVDHAIFSNDGPNLSKPEDLIIKHGRANLEEVFLKLSRSKSEFN